MFKTAAFGGFDKKAVLDYVYSLTQKAEEAQARLEDQLRAAEEERQNLIRDLEESRNALNRGRQDEDNIKSELEGERLRNLQLTELVSSQEDEIERQKQLVAQKTREMDEYIRRNGEISDKNKELEKTKNEVEQASAQIGRLIVESRTEAERIVAEAQDKAGVIIAQAKEKSEEVLLDAGVQAQRTIAEAGVEARRKTEDAQLAIDTAFEKFSVFRAEISTLQRTMLETLEEIHFKAGGISAAIDAAQDVMHQTGNPIAELRAESEAVAAYAAAEEAEEAGEAEDGPFFRYPAED